MEVNLKQTSSKNKDKTIDTLVAYNDIPYNLIAEEVGEDSKAYNQELKKIKEYYEIYHSGSDFQVEGTNGDYMPSMIHYKIAGSLIDKQARFLFSEKPLIQVEAQTDKDRIDETDTKIIDNINKYIDNVLEENNFEDILLKATKDAFIGKRVAALVNFNDEDGIDLKFIPSTQFIHEFDEKNMNRLSKFVTFTTLTNARQNKDKRILKKKYMMSDDSKVILNEIVYDGSGKLIEEVFGPAEVDLNQIPAVVFLNDGLTGDDDGESEIELLRDYESAYSKMANADIDAERKSMNPIRYAVNMNRNSTKDLTSSPGSFWDLEQSQDIPGSTPQIGMLESGMNYSESLKTTLERLRQTAYDQVDVPDISMDSMQGAITSGKGLKAIYWSSIIRSKEKMKVWGPGLRRVVEILIEGAIGYPKSITQYTDTPIINIAHSIIIEQRSPLPEDEEESKKMDLQEVNFNTMSRKTYMKKWHEMTDNEVDDELKQIALEMELFENSTFHDTSLLPRLN